ncbi:MAG: sugar transferase [Proteobacteria bacterium]|nr:MAG: sugar transferase [Pseudomonadota bacterium]
MSRAIPLIAHVLHRFDVGGLENGVVNLINTIPEDRFAHAILCMEGYNPEFCGRLNKKVDVISVDKKRGKDPGVYFRLYREFKRLQPDIVHTRNLSAIEAQLPAFLAGVDYRIHGEHGWDIYDPKGDVRKYQIIRKVFGLLVHRFIPLSSELEDYLVERVGISKRKITRICNGVDLTRFQNSIPETPGDWPFKGDDFVFGCVGRLEIIKGHIDLLRAFHIASLKEPSLPMRLCLVGEGSQRKVLEKFIVENNLSATVYLAGNRNTIPAYLKQFGCFVLPSHGEGISNTILEAMASGLPVIATRVGGNADLISEGNNGLLVDACSPECLASAMLRIASDRNLQESYSSVSRQRAAEHFSLPVMVDNYINVYSRKQV